MLTDGHWLKASKALRMAEGDDPDLARLRQRRKQRDRVEAAVRTAVGALTFDQATSQLRAGGRRLHRSAASGTRA
jgi:crotonobetainyl-CoA:carnitine CoA-transferase CaiB-like acyl-CoA transferase